MNDDNKEMSYSEEQWTIREEDPVTKEDEKRYVSVAMFKRWRKQTINDINAILQGLQRHNIVAEQRYTLAWNATNAILKSFLDRKLITEEDIARAGQELFRDARANLEKVREASAKKEQVDKSSLIVTPLEKMPDLIYPKDGQ